MPSWNIHLEAGERLCQALKFSGQKRQKFLLGCLLPDINNGYINRVEVTKSHEETHFTRDKKSSLNFYAKYKREVDERKPIYLGYLFHLYTDGYFNYEFYRVIKQAALDKHLSKAQQLDIKHHDFWIYDTNFEHQIGIKSEDELNMLTKEANKISTVEITPSEIMNVEEILQSEDLNAAISGEQYTIYTKEKLDAILDNMIQSFTKDYLGENHA